MIYYNKETQLSYQEPIFRQLNLSSIADYIGFKRVYRACGMKVEGLGMYSPTMETPMEKNMDSELPTGLRAAYNKLEGCRSQTLELENPMGGRSSPFQECSVQ